MESAAPAPQDTAPPAAGHTVTLRMADAGHTHFSWTWGDDPDAHHAARAEAGDVGRALRRLDAALSTADTRASALTSPRQERALAHDLASVFLPAQLRAQLHARSGGPLRLRVTPSPRLSRVPWELLAVGGDTRLVEVASVVHEAPLLALGGRGRAAEPWALARHRPALYVVDPPLPGADSSLLSQRLLEEAADRELHRHIGADPDGGRKLGRADLGAALRGTDASHLLYLGYVSGDPAEPSAAALHLSDPARTTWGLGHASATLPEALPLTAADLAFGTEPLPQQPAGRALPVPDARPGHQVWPMPPRVAAVGCALDPANPDIHTWALALAFLGGGAELATTVRWGLPTDHLLRDRGGRPPAFSPVAELATAVDRALRSPDPAAATAEWQRAKLAAWRAGGEVAHAPLVWAAPFHLVMPQG